MIDAGVTILASLGILSRQLASKRMRSAVAQVRWLIEQGQSLSDAFRSRPDVFPALLVNMVAAGEASGTLEESFERLADHFEKEYAVTQKVRTAMAYPTIVTIVALGVIVFMVVFVLPSFIGIFASIGAELPWPTRLVMGVSDFIRANWYLLAALLALGVIAVKFLSSTPNGAYTLDSLALRLPLFGELILKRAVSRFSRTLATLLRSGVPLLVSLSVTERTVGNLPVAAAISMASEEIRAGRGIVEPLRASRLFPQMIIEMMVVGEETGTVDQMLSKVADFYDKEIDVTVERLSSLIEPVIIVVLGAVVGFIMLSLIMPMFDIYSQLNL
jgi:type IV pilus assembly protein PilC